MPYTDYERAQLRLQSVRIILETGSNHDRQNFEEKAERMFEFITKKSDKQKKKKAQVSTDEQLPGTTTS